MSTLVRPNVTKTETETETNTETVAMTEDTVETVETNVAQEEAPAATQEVAVAEKNTAVAVASSGLSMAEHLAALEQQGASGLLVDAMSFDRVKLHEGTFKVGDNDEDLGKEINIKPMNIQAVHLFSRTDEEDEDEVFYSYDAQGRTDTAGNDTTGRLAEWAADGYGKPTVRTYQEVMAELVDRDDEWDGAIVNLSIPPASRNKFGGLVALTTLRQNCTMAQLVLNCTPSETLKSKGGKSYRRWVFKVARIEG